LIHSIGSWLLLGFFFTAHHCVVFSCLGLLGGAGS